MSNRFDWKNLELAELPLTHEAIIPEDYLDAMGHMNVMWYTHLFDQAVVGTFDLLGLDRRFMETNQAGGFALESHIRYLSEVRVGQKIKVHTRLIGRSEKRFHMLHFMTNDAKGDLASTFEVIGAYIDMKTRRTAPLPGEIAENLDRLILQHRALNWEAPLCGVMTP